MSRQGSLRVLMFGWEFPPVKSGGLGTASYGISRGLQESGVDVCFVLPRVFEEHESFTDQELIGAFDEIEISEIELKVRHVDTLLRPYQSPEHYQTEYKSIFKKHKRKTEKASQIYGKNLFEEVYRYGLSAGLIAESEEFDIIHAHDWMTFGAGIEAKRISGKPLVVHVHATDYDRTGGNPNSYIYDLEKQGMDAADKVVTVSHYTKFIIVNYYGIDPDKIEVVHNAVDKKLPLKNIQHSKFDFGDKVVLFLGRITLQKGPDYFIDAAKHVIDIDPEVKFIFVGSGDMEKQMIEKAAHFGISRNILFAGFLEGEDVDRAFQMADVYVMPSVSEPFGITPLEAIMNGTPVIISRQSGVSEVLSHALKIDFWDIRKLVDNILAIINNKYSLGSEMLEHSQREVDAMTWDKVGTQLKNLYTQIINQ